MKIWKLYPVVLDFAGWRYSNHKDYAIVRAENEKEAREIATLHFFSFTKRVPCQETPCSPWDNATVVKCTELPNSNYPTDGPPELLEAEGFEM